MLWVKQSTAVILKMGPFVDDTDGKTAETGLSIAQADIQISKNGGAFAQTSEGSPTTTHDADGWYPIPLTTTDTGTLGTIKVQVAMAGALPVWQECMVLPANVYDSLVSGSDLLNINVSKYAESDAVVGTNSSLPSVDVGQLADQADTDALGALIAALDNYSATRGLAGTALPDAAADAAGGLPTTTKVTDARLGALTDWIDGGRLDLLIDAIKAKTDLGLLNTTWTDAKAAFLDEAIGAAKTLTSAYDAAKTAAQAGNAMALTSGERTTLAAAIEAAIINELDGAAVMQAIADLIASDMTTGDLSVQAIASAVRDAILDRVLAGNHDEAGSAGKLLQTAATQPANFSALQINASGHVSRVTLVDTTTANTDMRGTDGALTTLGANAPAGWINADAVAASALNGKGDWSTFVAASDKVFLGNGAHGGAAASIVLADYSNFQGAGGADAATIYTYFTDGVRADAFKASGFSTFNPAIDTVANVSTVGSVTNPVTAGTVSDKTGYALTSAYDAAKTAAQAGDEMDLVDAPNATAVAAIGVRLEAMILDEGDATALLAAIAAKVEEFLVNEGDATATIAAIAAACNSAVVAGTVGTQVAAVHEKLPSGTIAAPGDEMGLSEAGVGAVLGSVVESGTGGNEDVTLKQAVAVIAAAVAGVLTGVGTNTITIKGANSSTTRLVANRNGAGDRATVTLTLP